VTPSDTREKLLDTAARLFHEQGYEATGIATILREAGVNSGSLYHFFPSKEALLAGVLERYVELLHPIVIAPAEERAEDGIERVFALLGLYRAGLELTEFNMGCPIGNLALELADTHPQIRPLIDLNFKNWIGALAGWLETAADRLPADADPRELAGFVLTVMEGGIMQARTERSLRPFDESVAHLRRYFDLLAEKAAS